MENDFLKKKYDLHNSPEVKSSAKRTESRTGEKVPQNPSEQIQNYLNRFREIIDRKDPEQREQGMEALKKVLYDKFIIKPEEIPESYFENQKRIAREQGHGDIEITDEIRNQLTEVIISDQQSTLNNWIDYLSSPDAAYPDWLKYYAFRSILGMGAYDKEKKEFAKRSKGTTKPFPDINREALAYVLDAISQKYGKHHVDLLALEPEEKKEFEKLLEGENFSKLYAWALDKTAIAPTESLEKVAGRWIKYPQNSDHAPLVESLQGYGTGWCVAGESVAKNYLELGDFYIYYSIDKKGKPTIPRAAIQMNGNQIGQVRGVAPEQNLDPYIGSVVQEKLKEFPDGKAYEKKVGDMKILTAIENKIKKGIELSKEDLTFIYEINTTIEGFGYQRDPRIAELRAGRNVKQDAVIIFECAENQIAYNINEVNKNTKAYVGKWSPEIMKKLPKNIEHLYESFPEKKIFQKTIELTTKTPKEYAQELISQGYKISNWAQDILNKIESLKQKEEIDLVSFSVEQLGFPNGATLQEIYDRAKEFKLELCPSQAGPELRLNYKDQPNGEYLKVAMEPINDRDGDPGLFGVDRGGSESWLSGGDGGLGGWGGGDRFVFRFRK